MSESMLREISHCQRNLKYFEELVIKRPTWGFEFFIEENREDLKALRAAFSKLYDKDSKFLDEVRDRLTEIEREKRKKERNKASNLVPEYFKVSPISLIPDTLLHLGPIRRCKSYAK